MKVKSIYFVTFCAWERLELNGEARQLVLSACRFFDHKRYKIFALVIMPDHVHLLIQLLPQSATEIWSLGKILHSIKSFSAKQIPSVMKHLGKVWQDGRYDRLVRSEQEFQAVLNYIRQDPVKAELSSTPEAYPFFWQSDEVYP